MPNELNFSIVANNNDTITIFVYDKDDDPVPLTGVYIKWQLFNAAGTVLITKTTLAGQIAVVPGPDGIMNGAGIAILAADTKGIVQGDYIHEAVTVDSGGNPVTVTDNDAILSYGTGFIRKQYTVQP